MKKDDKYALNLDKISDEQKVIGWVVDRTNYIENQLKEIIFREISSDATQKDFIKNIVLHNSNISLGAKLKIFFYLCDIHKWKLENRQLYWDLLKYRNGFAHSDTMQHIHVSLAKNRDVKGVEIFMTIDELSSSGQFKEVKREDALDEFIAAYNKVKEELDNIFIKKIKIYNKALQGRKGCAFLPLSLSVILYFLPYYATFCCASYAQ